jgi:hypothetical protein
MRLATIADIEAAMAKPPIDDSARYWDERHREREAALTETQVLPAQNRDDARDLVARMERRYERERHALQRRIDADEMVRIVADGIRLLNTPMMGSRGIPEDDVLERARNVTQAIMGLYRLERWP